MEDPGASCDGSLGELCVASSPGNNSPIDGLHFASESGSVHKKEHENIELSLQYAPDEVKVETIKIYRKHLEAVDQPLKKIKTVLFNAVDVNVSLKQHNNDVKELIRNKKSKEELLKCFIEKCISLNKIQPLHTVLRILKYDSDGLLQALRELFKINLVGENKSSVDSDDDISVKSNSSFESPKDWLLKPHEASNDNRSKNIKQTCLEQVLKPFNTENPSINYDQDDSLS